MGWIQSFQGPKVKFTRVLGAFLACFNLPLVRAQGVATSATAAWSSQIVAFWGAVGIGVRSSSWHQASNVLTSSIAVVTVIRRSNAIVASLSRSEWYVLAPGFHGGATRLDVLLICWSTKRELRSLATKAAIIAEAFGRSRWLLLIVGRQLQPNVGTTCSRIYWTQSPRCPSFSVVRFNGSRTDFLSFTPDDLEIFVNYHLARAHTIDDISAHIATSCNLTPARNATRDEAPEQVQQSSTIGRHVTSFQITEVVCPYVSLEKNTGQFATSRNTNVKTAKWMYMMVHITVAVAVGLMGAASGRALAVWLFSVRIIISKLGAEALTAAGDDVMLVLLGVDQLMYHVESHAGSTILPGDAILVGSPRWHTFAVLGLNVIEFCLLVGGWIYGALKVQKVPPNGLVGHGMLWLAIVVTLGLSVRTVNGIRARVTKGRLIGVFRGHDHMFLTIAHDCKLVIHPTPSTNQPSNGATSPPASTPNTGPSAYLTFIGDILTQVKDDGIAVKAALALMRQPTFCSEVQDYVTKEVLKYSYNDDTFSTVGGGSKTHTTAIVYPWIQALSCVVLTVPCAIFAAIYTYMDVPSYGKIVAEVALAVSAMWFATLDRTSGLPHNPSAYTCHMIACMVASAVWYVGVKDLG